jgi:hypothetical protein
MRLMRRERVVLTPVQRVFACEAFVEALLERGVEVIAFCVSAMHWHALLRFRNPAKHFLHDRDANVLIGQAKGKCAFMMSRAKIVPKGGIWGKKCRVRPVQNRDHQLNIAKYISAHAHKGAAIHLLPSIVAKPGALAPGPHPSRP